ncbi:MAG: hypothetical protein E7058_08330 [Lentisphaerae bacterium]|nr:hypothetical protein [Lentisphaerota bacterium]
MNIKKVMLAVLALMLCTGVYAGKKIRLAPGASCFAWSEKTKNKPDSVPNGGFVDEANVFDSVNIHACEELKSITDNGFIMWEGYLQVPKSGDYRFSLIWGNFDGYAKIFLNNQTLLTREFKGPKNITAQATLKRGFVKVRIYLTTTRVYEHGWGSTSFSFKFAPKMSMKMTDINPSIMFHPVDNEE